MKRIQTNILIIFGAVSLLGCQRSNNEVQIIPVVTENYGNLATVTHFVCSGTKPGHLRIFWDIPEDCWGRHHPGCGLTLNPKNQRYEASVSVTTEKAEDGKCKVMLAFGSSWGASAGSRDVTSNKISFDVPSTVASGSYDSDIAVGSLLGHPVVFSLDSEYFDYENGKRIKSPQVAGEKTKKP